MSEQTTTLPAKLKEQAEQSGIALNRAEKIASGYAPFLAEAQEIANKIKGLDKTNPDDAAIAKRARIDLGHLCARAEAQKKADKEKLNIAQKYIDGLYNTVNGLARLTQGEADEIEKYQINLIKAQQEKLEKERIVEFAPYLVGDEEQRNNAAKGLKLGEMPDDVYVMLLNGYKAQHEMRVKAEQEAEAKRIADEKQAAIVKARKEAVLPLQIFKLEDDKVIEEFTDAEFDEYMIELGARKVAIDKENERVRKQNELAQKKLAEEAAAKKALEEKLAQAEADKKKEEEARAKEKEALQKQLKDAEDAKARYEAEQKRVEAQAKADEAAKVAEEAQQAENARLAAEKAAKAPVKEKLLAWVESFQLPQGVEGLPDPSINIMERFDAFKDWAKKEVEKL